MSPCRQHVACHPRSWRNPPPRLQGTAGKRPVGAAHAGLCLRVTRDSALLPPGGRSNLDGMVRLAWPLGGALASLIVALASCSAGNDTESQGQGGTDTGAGAGSVGPGPGVGGAGGSITVGTGVGGSIAPSCKVTDSGNAVPPCTRKSPPDAFSPVVQWTWTVPASGASYPGSVVTPLVGNFTDDNADGAIDLCDIPDVIVATMDASPSPNAPGSMYMLAG